MIRRVAPPLIALLLLLGAWELYVDLGGADPLVLPAPHAVASALYTDRHELFSNFWITAKELVLGILAGILVACALATAIHFSLILRRAVYPLLVASQALPTVLVAAVLVIWLGFGLGTKLAIIGLVSFFPVVVTTLARLEATDPDQIKLMRTFGATRWQIFRHVELPAALPGIFTGAKLASVAAVTGAVFAEQSGSDSGLGYLFLVSINQLQASVAFAATVLLVGFAVAVFVLLSVAERRLLPWAFPRPQSLVGGDPYHGSEMKRLPCSVAMVAAAVLLAGCGEVTNTLTPPAGTANVITVALDSPPNLTQVGIIDADALGYFKQTDEDVRFIVSPHPIDDLHNHKAQIALTSEPEIIEARNHHTALAAVAAVLQGPGKPQVVCATSGSARTSGTGTATSSSATTTTLTRTTTVPRAHPPLHAPTHRSGHVSSCKASYRTDPTYAGAPTYNALNFVVTENEIINHAPVIRRFVQAVGRGYAAVRANPSQAAENLVKRRPGVPYAEALTGVKAFLPDFFPSGSAANRPWGWQVVKDWNSFGTWLFNRHIITNVNATPDADTNELLAGQGV